MSTLFNYLKEFMAALTWEVVVLLIIVLLRKHLLKFIGAVTKRVERPGELVIGKDGISIKDYVDKKIEEEQNETISMITETGVGKKQEKRMKLENISRLHGVPTDEMPQFSEEYTPNADPLKTTWQGKPQDKNRKVTASVVPIPNSKLYKIKLDVVSTSGSDPLKGEVRFHLHPTFDDPIRTVQTKKGKAELKLISYGSFTLGVETDGGTRKLKLDLASDVPGVSEEFRNT